MRAAVIGARQASTRGKARRGGGGLDGPLLTKKTKNGATFPQGLKPACFFGFSGTARSRALPGSIRFSERLELVSFPDLFVFRTAKAVPFPGTLRTSSSGGATVAANV